MGYIFSTYKTKVKNTTFENSSKIKFEDTIAIIFYDEYKREVQYKEMGFISTNEIYKKISNGDSLNLDECFIENFNINEYRRLYNLPVEDSVIINGFSANNAVFEAQYENNFSNIIFDCDNFTLKSTIFIKGKVNFKNTQFAKKKNDFSYCLFNDGNVSFYKTKFGIEDSNFKNAIFKSGEKNFQFCDFNTGRVLFENVNFGDGDVNFINTNFSKGDISFKIASFGNGKVDFHYSTFGKGKVNFEKVNFGKGHVNFKMVEFGDGKCNFNKTIFGKGDVDFEGSEIKTGKITFKKAIFGEGRISFENVIYANANLVFDGTMFNADLAHFKGSEFKILSFKSCHLDNYFDLRVKKCENLILSDVIIRDIVDIKPYKDNVDIKTFDFSGLRLLGSIYIDWKKNNVKYIIKNQKETSLHEKTEQFLMLKENFNNIGQYDSEDKSYIEFKRSEEKEISYNLKQSSFIHKSWGYPAYFFRILIFDYAGLYATNPVRVLFSMFASYFIFSIIYVIMHLLHLGILTGQTENTKLLTNIGDSFYFSAITYLTVGYGDFSPLGINRWFAGIEGFVGVFLMAYFTVAFVRKILR